MDKQTAIDLLDNLLGMVEDNHDSDYDTAIKMGIDAIKEKTQLSKEDATKDATLQQDMSGNMSGTQNPLDCISRQAAIDEIDEWIKAFRENGHKESAADACLIQDGIIQLPSAQPDQTDCEYCHEDSDGYVKPIEKNSHAFIRFGMDGWELSLKANGWHGSAKIRYCPMCGRDLRQKGGRE